MIWKHWEALFIERPRWIVWPVDPVVADAVHKEALHEIGTRQG
jgi:hypothetical protein